MKIAVIGTGPVGQALAGKLAELGHEVTVGTRDPGKTVSRTEPDYLGNPPFEVWQEEHPDVGLATPAEAAGAAELVVNATNGAGPIAMLEAAGHENLAGKVLVDVANPLDYSQGMPSSLFVSNTDLRRGRGSQAPALGAASELRLACRAHPRSRRHLLGPRDGDVRRLLASSLGGARDRLLQHRGRTGAGELIVVSEWSVSRPRLPRHLAPPVS